MLLSFFAVYNKEYVLWKLKHQVQPTTTIAADDAAAATSIAEQH